MSEYGVIPTGFSRKPLAVILAEIETGNITEFGPQVVQTSQSPLGQINGLFADHTAELWEFAEDIYQSYDPDQAEGVRLDSLAKMRLINRFNGETDISLRQALTNQSTARIGQADFTRDLQNVEGVTYRQIFVNDTNETDVNGMPPHTIAAAVIGGDDQEIGEIVHRYVIPGISTHGNTVVTVLDEGFCRSLRIIRPSETPTNLRITVRVQPDRFGCPPPSAIAIETLILNYLRAVETRPLNGQAITNHSIRSFVEAMFPNVEVIEVAGRKNDDIDYTFNNIPFSFQEIANVTDVSVVVA